MKAAARRIMEQFAPEALPPSEPAIDGKVNALEAPYIPAPYMPANDPLPATWTLEHVQKRLVEAYETILKLPPDRGPRMPGNSWPPHLHDWGDLNSQEGQTDEEKAWRRKQRNRFRVRPTADELRHMEAVLEWLSALHAQDGGLSRVVQRWAKLRALRKSIKDDCRRTGLSFQMFYRRRDKGIAAIVARLAGKAVW